MVPGASRTARPAGQSPTQAADCVRAFLGAHAAVEIWENGQRLAGLAATTSGFSLATETGHLVCHFWSAEANLVRRVLSAEASGPRQLRLQCLRLGQSRPTPLRLLAADAPGSPGAAVRLEREEFRQAVLAAAARDWPGWLPQPGAHAPGPRSAWLRLLFRRGPALLPCLALAADPDQPGAAAPALEQALAWTAAVRQRWPTRPIAAVRLILPPGAIPALAARLSWLRTPPQAPAIECFRLDRSAGWLEPVPLDRSGNLDSGLRRAPAPATHLADEAAALLAQMRLHCPQTTLETGPDGGWVFRLYGLEIARQASPADALAAPFQFGCGREQSPLLPASQPLFTSFLRSLGAQRLPGGDRRDPLYSLQPEHWMEHLLRSDLRCLDPALDPRFVYSQVPLCQPGERDVLDLLAVARDGRMVVIELKADEDLGFPLQALDYWRRVRHHQLAGDFTRLGYFPGVELSLQLPRLWLVAPALRWHPQADAVGAWISPQIPCTRFGINEEWRRGIQILDRRENPYA